jgi:hypothetical protein
LGEGGGGATHRINTLAMPTSIWSSLVQISKTTTIFPGLSIPFSGCISVCTGDGPVSSLTASRADQSGDFYLCCCGLGAWPQSVHDQREVERLENRSGRNFCQAWQRDDRTSRAGLKVSMIYPVLEELHCLFINTLLHGLNYVNIDTKCRHLKNLHVNGLCGR